MVFLVLGCLGKVVKFGRKFSVIPRSFTLIRTFRMTAEWRDDIRWQGWNQEMPHFRQKSRMTEWAPAGSNCQSDVTPVIPTKCHFMSFLCSNDYEMSEMMPEWLYFVTMKYGWRNDTRMKEWHSNDRMTSGWLDGIRMMEWHLRDVLRLKWARNDETTKECWNGTGMAEWYSNERMAFKWQNDTQMRLYFVTMKHDLQNDSHINHTQVYFFTTPPTVTYLSIARGVQNHEEVQM